MNFNNNILQLEPSDKQLAFIMLEQGMTMIMLKVGNGDYPCLSHCC